jgi:hypothetical protein
MVMDCLGEEAEIGKTLRGEFEELIVKVTS